MPGWARSAGIIGFAQFLSVSCAAAELPAIDFIFPAGGKRGTTLEIRAEGKLDPWPVEFRSDSSGLIFKPKEKKGEWEVEIGEKIPLGPHWVRAFTPQGISAPRLFMVSEFNELLETEPNDRPEQGIKIESLPLVINGRLEKSEDTDSFTFELEPGKTFVAMVEAYGLDSPVDPLLFLRDDSGRKVAFTHDGRRLDPILFYPVERAGKFTLQLAGFAYPPRADVRFTGGNSAVYRLTVTCGPVAQYAFPSGVARGTKAEVQLFGVNFPEGAKSLPLEVDATGVVAEAGQLVVYRPNMANRLIFGIGEGPAVLEVHPDNPSEKAQVISLPAMVQGRIEKAGDQDRFQFEVKKGEQWSMRVRAAEMESPLDAVLVVEDASGKQLVRADDAPKTPDAELTWTAPGDGVHEIAVSDLLGRGGPEYVYQLEIERTRPGTDGVTETHAVRVEPGKTAELNVKVTRKHGDKRAVKIEARDLPAGISLEAGDVPEKGGDVKVTFSANDEAAVGHHAIRLVLAGEESERPVQVNVKGQHAELDHLLMNEVERIWLTVPPKSSAATAAVK